MARRKRPHKSGGKTSVVSLVVIAMVAIVAVIKTGRADDIIGSMGDATASALAETVTRPLADVAGASRAMSGSGSAAVSGVTASELERVAMPHNTRSEIVQHTGYVVSHNSKWKIPNWVAYELTRREVAGTNPRNDEFCPDPDVRGHKAQLEDYRGSGYDRGHMAPAADMKWSKKVMRESFYLSNMCPQNPSLNRGDWNDLEEKVRKWAKRDSAIIVVCGPIIPKRPKTIGHGKVAVPTAFFKVVLSPYGGQTSAIGFIMPNEKCNAPLKTYARTIDEVEAATGFDFFAALPDDVEQSVEVGYSLDYWNL